MPLASLALDGILGGAPNNDSGEKVDPLKGWILPTVYRCVSILSTVVASCRLEVIDTEGTATPWSDLQGLQSYTAFELIEIMVAHLAGWGNFYARKIMNGPYKLIDLQPIYPGNVQVYRQRGKKMFRIRKTEEPNPANPVPNPNMSAEWDTTDESQIFHVPFLGYDGLQGMSPIVLAAQTFGTAMAADRLAARFYSRGQQLGGILKVKVPLAKQEQADAMKSQWRASHGGVRNSGDVAILDSETDFMPITIAPEALQFLQSRQWQAQELARIFGVPLTMLSFDSTGYGDAIETQQIGFVTYTVRSYTDRIEQRVGRDLLPRGKNAEFDLDRLMRGSMLERYQAYNTGIAGGWLLRSEARSNENMTEVKGLDVPLEPTAVNGQMNMPPLSVPGSEPAQNPNPQAVDAPPMNPDQDDDSD